MGFSRVTVGPHGSAQDAISWLHISKSSVESGDYFGPETSQEVRNRIFWNEMKKQDADCVRAHVMNNFTDDNDHKVVHEYVRKFGKRIEEDGELKEERRGLNTEEVMVGGSGAMTRVFYCLKYPLKVNDPGIQNATALSLGVAKSLARHGAGGTEIGEKTNKEKGLSTCRLFCRS